jgi:hypothetical protein
MMRIMAILLTACAIAGGCSTLPVPVGSGLPATCADRFSEPQCKQGQRCRWINDARRTDGTYATARCADE